MRGFGVVCSSAGMFDWFCSTAAHVWASVTLWYATSTFTVGDFDIGAGPCVSGMLLHGTSSNAIDSSFGMIGGYWGLQCHVSQLGLN